MHTFVKGTVPSPPHALCDQYIKEGPGRWHEWSEEEQRSGKRVFGQRPTRKVRLSALTGTPRSPTDQRLEILENWPIRWEYPKPGAPLSFLFKVSCYQLLPQNRCLARPDHVTEENTGTLVL